MSSQTFSVCVCVHARAQVRGCACMPNLMYSSPSLTRDSDEVRSRAFTIIVGVLLASNAVLIRHSGLLSGSVMVSCWPGVMSCSCAVEAVIVTE